MKNFLRKSFVLSVVSIILASMLLTSCLSTFMDSLDGVLGTGSGKSTVSFTNDEAVSALNDALVEGIGSASKNLSKTDAYFKNAALKILLPSEAQPILDVLNQIPGGKSLADNVVLRLNRTAETAAKDTVSIFTSAIKTMTIVDGIKIATGSNTEATQYLKNKCYDKLVTLYKPMINSVLNKPLVMNMSANEAWTNLVTTYNKYGQIPNAAAKLTGSALPFPPVEVDLAKYATEKALDGLFLKIGEEEGKIRKNPFNYASNMIQKVFGSLIK